MKRRCAVAGALGAGTALLTPVAASAHGLSGRQDVPLPTWLFAWGASLVLVISFAALASLWPKPRLQEDSWRPMPAGLSRILTSRALELACAAAGVILFGLVIYSGLRGSQLATENFAPTFVYIVFWLLPLPLSVLFGDVFKAFNPWRAVGRGVAWIASRIAREPLPAPLDYPRRLGRWPAVIGILAFAWLELATPDGESPQKVAIAAMIYSAVTWVGMALYGVDTWVARGEAFSVYFNLISRISIFERRGDRMGTRRLLSGLAQWEPLPGSVVFVIALIGTVSFDGFSAGPTWNGSIVAHLQTVFRSIGLGSVQGLQLTFGLGMLTVVALMLGFYWLGVIGAKGAGGGFSALELARTFAHSLAPIALVYAAAHYVSFLLLQGQGIIPLLSDPLGKGSDLFGTADATINFGLIGAAWFWYTQVALVMAGHVAALILAHDRAVAIYDDPRTATRSQYWMLGVMVGFTSLALWLLSEASKL